MDSDGTIDLGATNGDTDKICANCDYFFPSKEKEWIWGKCGHDKVSDDNYNEDALVQGGGEDGYGDFIRMKPEFGCILFKAT